MGHNLDGPNRRPLVNERPSIPGKHECKAKSTTLSSRSFRPVLAWNGTFCQKNMDIRPRYYANAKEKGGELGVRASASAIIEVALLEVLGWRDLAEVRRRRGSKARRD